ncbi:PLC-like phosphodiesterase [Peniophora sp. CONT]|nr:PLC-like phosphodiesterase [Peniophora sp. CONT]
MFSSTLSLGAPAALSLLLSTAQAATPLRRATTCNGFSELCDRSFGNITFVGAHDSYAVGTGVTAANQDYDITQQLNDGVRMLQVQAHNKDGTIELCHSSCSLLDGGSLQDYLGTLKSWIDSNPNDVVSLLIVNIDDLPATQFGSVFQAAGVDSLSYSPTASSLPASQWPTLGSLIDNGTRLITFMDFKADFTSVPYIIDEFTNIWETAFDVTDTSFDCAVNRSSGDTSTSMYLINHFLDKTTNLLGTTIFTPDISALNTTNAVSGTGSLGQQVSTCSAEYGRNPNFMLVDYYEYGNGSVFEVAATANGVTYNPTSAIATPKASSSSTTAAASSAMGPMVSAAAMFSFLAAASGVLVGGALVL